MRGGAFLNGKEGRIGFRIIAQYYCYIPSSFGKGDSFGSGLRTLPQGFLSPARGTEGGLKTIEDRWGKSILLLSMLPHMKYHLIEFFHLL